MILKYLRLCSKTCHFYEFLITHWVIITTPITNPSFCNAGRVIKTSKSSPASRQSPLSSGKLASLASRDHPVPGERLEVRLLWNHGRLAAEPSPQMFAVFHFFIAFGGN